MNLDHYGFGAKKGGTPPPPEDTRLPDFTVEKVFTTFSQSFDWSLKYSNIPETWKTTQGDGIVVAVIDTGVPQHIDIGDNAIAGGSFVDN